MKHFLILVALLTILSATVNAQTASASAQASISASIITPIIITKTTDLSFGNAVAGVSLGTVVISTSGNRTSTGGVILPSALAGTISQAKFETSGAANQAYAITLPATATLTSSSNTMIVDTFTSNPTIASGGTLSVDGKQDIYVGATLNVGASQPAGNYTGTFDITVAYN